MEGAEMWDMARALCTSQRATRNIDDVSGMKAQEYKNTGQE